MWKRVPFVALLALVLALPATGGVGESVAAKKRVRLKAFTSCSALVKYARGHATRVYGPVPPPVPEGVPAPPLTGTLPESTGDARGEDSSTTNVQEAGVDEPDIVKTDGSRIFAVDDNHLHSVDVRPDRPRLLDTLDLGAHGSQLLLDGDRLLAITGSGYYGGDGPVALDVYPGYYRPQSVLTEIDVSDPARMRVVKTQTIEGAVVSSRLNGRSARIVITTPPEAIYEGTERARSSVRGWVPTSTYVNRRTGRKRTRSLAACRTVRRPPAFAGLDMLSVVTVDMSRGLPSVDVDSIMAGGELVYASTESLYVATQRWYDTPEPNEEAPRTTTAIHKFDITDPVETRYRGSGSVSGYLLNQFSMSERKGVLRVASTDSPSWWMGRPREESQSYVTTLEDRAGTLTRIGRVGGLGRGERIYAVRFFDDTGFVVTFRETDPLYSIDLGDPRDPRVVGELKIEGYSAYLHPVGEHLLLGVGQDATPEGRRKGTQLSLFDVSDLSRPRRIQQAALGGSSYSEVEYDHHAFLWWEPERLAVLPVSLVSAGDVATTFQGAIGFHVERSGIDEAGRTEHRDSGGYASPVTRSLVVRGRLFTVSGAGVQLNDLGTLKEQASVEFPAPAPPPAPPGPEPAPARPSR